jgi:hypothetical protein
MAKFPKFDMPKQFMKVRFVLESGSDSKATLRSDHQFAAYLEFAASSPALYEVMFSLILSVPFDDAATSLEMRFALSQLLELFQVQSSKSEVMSELFWASLHGIAELTRTKRFAHSRQNGRVSALVELFTFPKMKRHRW